MLDQRLLPCNDPRDSVCELENDVNDRTLLRSVKSVSGLDLGKRSPVHGLFQNMDSSSGWPWSWLELLGDFADFVCATLSEDKFVGGFDNRLVA